MQAQLVLSLLQQRAHSLSEPSHGPMQQPQQQERQPMNGHAYDSPAPLSTLQPMMVPWQQQQHQQQVLHSMLSISSEPSSTTPPWLQQLQGPASDTELSPFWSSAVSQAAAGGGMLGSTAEQLGASGMDPNQLFTSIADMFDPPGSPVPAASKPATWASVVGGADSMRDASGGAESEAGEGLGVGHQGEGDASKLSSAAQVGGDYADLR